MRTSAGILAARLAIAGLKNIDNRNAAQEVIARENAKISANNQQQNVRQMREAAREAARDPRQAEMFGEH